MQVYLNIWNLLAQEQILHLLTEYKYLILFPFAIVEGPIIAVIAGFLCTGGFLDPLFVYPIIVLGDITGDSLCYSLGRWGKPGFLNKIGKWFGLKSDKIDRARIFFDANPIKTISLSKIILGIGFAGIFLAGNAKVPYLKFLKICLVTSAIQYTVYLTLGILFGNAYVKISHYLNNVAAICILIAIALILFFSIKSMLRKI